MATLSAIRPGAANTTGLPTTGTIIAAPGGATALSDDSVATFDSQNTNASGRYQYGRDLGAMPGDFATMTTVLVQYQLGWDAAPSNTQWVQLAARIMASDGTTVLAANTAGGAFEITDQAITFTSPTLGTNKGFTYVNTAATKAQWEGAILQTEWLRNRTKGGDTTEQRVYEATITGTYEVAANPAILNQAGWRLRNDDGTQASATWKADNNTTVEPATNENIRVRFAVENTDATNPGPASPWSLWYSKNSGAYAEVTAASSNVRLADSTAFATNDATTDQAVGGAGAFESGYMVEATGTPGADGMAVSSHTEVEFNFQILAADVADFDTIKLRIYKGGDPLSGAYTQDGLTLTMPASPSTLFDVTDWAFYQDGLEASSALLTLAKNQGAIAEVDTPTLLRFLVTNNEAGTLAFKPKLMYRYIDQGDGGAQDWTPARGGVADIVPMNDVTASSTHLNAVASGTISDEAATTQRLGAGTFTAGKVDTGDGTFSAAWEVPTTNQTEVVFSIEMDSTDMGAGLGGKPQYENYQFKIVDADTGSEYQSYVGNLDAQGNQFASLNPPMTFEFDFEGGTNGVDIAATDAAPDTFDAVIGDAGTSRPRYTNAAAMHGTLAGEINYVNTDAVARFRWHDMNMGSYEQYLRLYIYYPTALPSTAHRWAEADGGYEGGDETSFALTTRANGTLELRDGLGTNIATTAAMAPDTWYRVEVRRIRQSVNTTPDGLLQMRLYEGDSETILESEQILTATTRTEWEDFEIATITATQDVNYYFDDIKIVNGGTWIGPALAGDNYSHPAATTSASAATVIGGRASSGASATVTASTPIATGTKSASGAATESDPTNTFSTGTKQASGASVESDATNIVATGVAAESISLSGDAVITGPTAISATGARSSSGAAVESDATNITGAGIANKSGNPSLPTVAGILSSGRKAIAADGSISSVSDLTSAGTKAASGASSNTAATDTAATGDTFESRSGDATTSATTSTALTGAKAAQGAVDVSGVSSVTSIGQRASDGSSDVSGALAVTSIGSKEAYGTFTASAITDTAATGAKDLSSEPHSGDAIITGATGITTSGISARADDAIESLATGTTVDGSKAASGTATESSTTGTEATGATGVAASGDAATSAATTATATGTASNSGAASTTSTTSTNVGGTSARAGSASTDATNDVFVFGGVGENSGGPADITSSSDIHVTGTKQVTGETVVASLTTAIETGTKKGGLGSAATVADTFSLHDAGSKNVSGTPSIIGVSTTVSTPRTDRSGAAASSLATGTAITGVQISDSDARIGPADLVGVTSITVTGWRDLGAQTALEFTIARLLARGLSLGEATRALDLKLNRIRKRERRHARKHRRGGG